MNNKNTTILASLTLIIVAIAVIAGFVASQPAAPQNSPQTNDQQAKPTTLSSQQLATLLPAETLAINQAISLALPRLTDAYVISTGKLYAEGQWYGTTLMYKGSDEANRDTLRLLLQKKDGAWVVRTLPPQPLLNKHDLPDVPKNILQDINQPAPLPGTASSPAIN